MPACLHPCSHCVSNKSERPGLLLTEGGDRLVLRAFAAAGAEAGGGSAGKGVSATSDGDHAPACAALTAPSSPATAASASPLGLTNKNTAATGQSLSYGWLKCTSTSATSLSISRILFSRACSNTLCASTKHRSLSFHWATLRDVAPGRKSYWQRVCCFDAEPRRLHLILRLGDTSARACACRYRPSAGRGHFRPS